MLSKAIMRAGGAGGGIKLINSSYLVTTSNATRTLDITGIQPGDLLFAMVANIGTTASAAPAGYTAIRSANAGGDGASNISLRLQYKFASSTSDSITWSGHRACLIAFRNASSIGSSAIAITPDSSIPSPHPIPGLSALNNGGTSMLIGGNHALGSFTYSGVTSPWQIYSNTFAYLPKNTLSSFATGSYQISWSNANQIIQSYWSAEIRI